MLASPHSFFISEIIALAASFRWLLVSPEKGPSAPRVYYFSWNSAESPPRHHQVQPERRIPVGWPSPIASAFASRLLPFALEIAAPGETSVEKVVSTSPPRAWLKLAFPQHVSVRMWNSLTAGGSGKWHQHVARLCDPWLGLHGGPPRGRASPPLSMNPTEMPGWGSVTAPPQQDLPRCALDGAVT